MFSSRMRVQWWSSLWLLGALTWLTWNATLADSIRPSTTKLRLSEPPPGTDVYDNLLHIVFSTDNRTLPGLLAAVRSVIVNTKRSLLLRFYFIAKMHEGTQMRSALECMFNKYTNPNLRNISLGESIHSYRVIEFNITEYDPSFQIAYREASNLNDRSSPNNYARLYLHQMLRRPELVGYPLPNKVLCLDTDIIVQADVGELLQSSLVHTEYPVAMPSRAYRLNKYTIRFEHPILAEWNRRNKGTSKEIKRGWTAYNNGICIQHLQRWQDYNITRSIDFWIKANLREQLFSHSFNPPYLLGLLNRVEPLDRKWSTSALGYKTKITQKALDEGRILHWTGPSKPWEENGFYKHQWKPYHCEACLHRRFRRGLERLSNLESTYQRGR
eukprot:gb/GECG01000464.1/.p1 GENE.gb/GECG01000464.1/~~gb/GECG01000464.1/.p1  ORF type:complete len:385 (+),score=17.93 gb/GECG01000464.1/:1-1155(+)